MAARKKGTIIAFLLLIVASVAYFLAFIWNSLVQLKVLVVGGKKKSKNRPLKKS